MEPPVRPDRDSLFLLAAMRVDDHPEPLRIKVRNLSPGGMMAECPVQAVPGERVKIDLRHVGWIGGTVAWVSDQRFGVIFDRQIDCKAVRQPVAAGETLPASCVPRPAIHNTAVSARPLRGI